MYRTFMSALFAALVSGTLLLTACGDVDDGEFQDFQDEQPQQDDQQQDW